MGTKCIGRMQGRLIPAVVLVATMQVWAQFAPMLVYPFAGGFQIEGFVTIRVVNSAGDTVDVFATGRDFVLRIDSGLIVYEQHTTHKDSINWFRDGDTLRTPVAGSPMSPCFGVRTSVTNGGPCFDGVRAFYVISEGGATNAFVRIEPIGGGQTTAIGPMNFIVPTIRWVDSQGNPITSANLNLRTGTPDTVRAQIIGLNNAVCTSCNAKLAISRDAGAESLIFRTIWSQNNSLDSIIFTNGLATFLVGALTPVNSGGFSLTGLPDLQGSNRITSDYPGSIQITFPDAAVLDSAWILDSDGDGWGDSLVGWFDRSLQVLPDSLSHSWPRNGDLSTLSGSVSLAGNRIGARVVETILRDTTPAGILRAVVSTEGGSLRASSVAISSRIGPVLQTVTLLVGVGGAPDTLVAIFNKPIDTSFSTGNGFLLNGTGLRVSAVDEQGSRVRFTVAPGVAVAGDSLRIAVNGGIVAFDGNLPAANNQAVAIRAALRVPPLSDNGNGFWDRNGDGRMDSVTLEFLEPLSQNMLAELDLRFVWMDANGRPVELRPPANELVWNSTNPTRVGWKVEPGELGIQAGLTSLDSGFQYGYGVLIRNYMVNGQEQSDTLPIAMADRMAPVILQAWLDPESVRRDSPDGLRLSFSEPVNTEALRNLDFLEFLVKGELRLYDISNSRWSGDNTILDLDIARGELLALRPNPHDSVRSNGVPDGISDLEGNTMAVSPWIMLSGNPRVLIEFVPMGLANSIADEGPAISAHFHSASATLRDIADGTSVGVLLDVGMGILPDSLGELDLSAIGFQWKLMVFTNLGGHVATMGGEVNCDDAAFSENGNESGNCLLNQRKLYVGWNLRAEDGRKAGVGAFVAKFHLSAWGARDTKKVEEIFTWGVKSSGNTRSLVP